MKKSAFRPGGDARVLLDSARDDAPPPGGFERELARHGLDATSAIAGPTASASGARAPSAAPSGGGAAAKLAFPTQLFAALGVLGISGALVFELGFRQDSAPVKTVSATASLAPALPARSETPREIGIAPSAAAADKEPSERAVGPISVSDLPDAPSAGRGADASSSAGARGSSPISEPSSGSLAEEIAALDRARASIARSPDEALALLDAHARQYPKTPFRSEAALVRVEALVAAGRRSEAEKVAEPYVREQGDAPVVRRMRHQLDASRASKP